MGEGATNLRVLEAEIDGYWQILLGRVDLPIDNGVLSLMETAVAMYSRASEITASIQKDEYQGTVSRGSRGYRFRTGPLRTFMEACSKMIDLGSRRLTAAKLESEMRDHE